MKEIVNSRWRMRQGIGARNLFNLLHWLCLFTVLLLVTIPSRVSAQDAGASVLQIYLQKPYQKIADIDGSLDYSVIARGSRWSTIRFSEPAVPGWVSKSFVTVSDAKATVTADVLNVRLRPSQQSRVMTQVDAGFVSDVTGEYADFVQIKLPPDFEVAIRNNGASTASVTNADKPLKGDKASSPQSPELHRIAPGDSISLRVFGEDDLSTENVRVPQSGQVSFPLVGTVSVAGKTTDQIERDMIALLSQGYVRNPRVSVTIFSYRPIFIRGGVNTTGAFPYTEGLTVAKAIALAGGSKGSARVDGVSVLRDGETVVDGLSIDSTYRVASGDVISVTEDQGEDDKLYIYVHGEVQAPGEYIYRRGLTVEKAIVLASGYSLRASKRKISVTRYAGVGQDEEPIKMKRVELYTPIEPGDVINVGASWF
jgi:protein involved in polysaccharide export with SLBB domain